jgi:hypothetical protein
VLSSLWPGNDFHLRQGSGGLAPGYTRPPMHENMATPDSSPPKRKTGALVGAPVSGGVGLG